MKIDKKSMLVGICALLLLGCKENGLRISDDTFVLDREVYKIIDNEVLSLGALDQWVKEYSILELDSLRDMGDASMSYIKPTARATLQIIWL